MLRQDQLDFLEARFTQEQPLLASALAELTDAVDCPADAWQSSKGDSRLEQFGQMLVRGSCLAELFRREAGHALRRLDETEINSILESNVQVADALVKASAPGGPDIFSSSEQPDLLRGIVIGHFSSVGFSEREGKGVLILRFLVQALHRACGDTPPDHSGNWDAGRIGVVLSSQGDPMRRQALAAAEPFRAELSPLFIAELESWVADPKTALEEDGSLGMHGLFLLGRWREDSAWPVFRKLFSLSGEIGYDLLGDLITEDGSILLAMVGGNRREELRAMVEDEKLDEYCRNACLDALTCLVAWDELPRADHVAHLCELPRPTCAACRRINTPSPEWFQRRAIWRLGSCVWKLKRPTSVAWWTTVSLTWNFFLMAQLKNGVASGRSFAKDTDQ